MNDRQRHALAAPCFRAMDTFAPQFTRSVTFKGARWGTIFTINK